MMMEVQGLRLRSTEARGQEIMNVPAQAKSKLALPPPLCVMGGPQWIAW